MSVILKVTDTRRGKTFLVEEYEGSTTHAVVTGYLNQGPDWRFSPDTIRKLLTMNDDIRLSSPTWDVRFELTFQE
jgi:hypothetical protein